MVTILFAGCSLEWCLSPGVQECAHQGSLCVQRKEATTGILPLVPQGLGGSAAWGGRTGMCPSTRSPLESPKGTELFMHGGSVKESNRHGAALTTAISA